MLRRLFAVRLITTLIVIFTLINSFALILVGAFLSVKGIIGIVRGGIGTEAHPALMILESLDVFLIALVFLIFAIGIAKLFHPGSDEELSGVVPSWLNIHNFGELKLVLWEAIMTTLVVLFAAEIVKHGGEFSWTMMVIPASILLLSVSMFVLKKSEEKESPKPAYE
jgi:uncharacterized membrane protein YqhA